MIQIKKTLLTLVALLALTTGAWADDAFESLTTEDDHGQQKEFIGQNIKITGGYIDQAGFMIGTGETVTISVLNGKVVTKVEMPITYRQSWSDGCAVVCTPTATITGTYAVGQTLILTGGYASEITLSMKSNSSDTGIQVKNWKVYYGDAPSGPEVDWNKTTKTGTFSMPGGNVELEPEYYPQAALTAAPTAINDVPATTDGAILKAGTVATIGTTEQAQGTVMYYVSPTALDDAALLALAADQWTADVPTAAHLAQGQAYVYYYVRGNDSDTDDETFSDGDILAANALTVTIAAAPTYAVTFAEGTDANEWTASPATDVTKGQTVTVTYTGTKKVLGVKAEKKSAAEGKTLAEATVGMIVGTDGKAYAAADKDNLPDGVTAVALVCYKNGSHGLALALVDMSTTLTWDNTGTNNGGKTAAECCSAWNTSTPVKDAEWLLASEDQWDYMLGTKGAGSSTALRDGFTSVGGVNLQSGYYWSSTEYESGYALYYNFDDFGSWDYYYKDLGLLVRACLAF